MSLFFSRQLRKNGIIFSNNFFCKNNLKDLGYNPVVIELSFIHFIIKIINETSRLFWQKNHRFFNMIFKNSRLFNKRSWRAFIFRIYWLRPLLSNDGQTKNFRKVERTWKVEERRLLVFWAPKLILWTHFYYYHFKTKLLVMLYRLPRT